MLRKPILGDINPVKIQYYVSIVTHALTCLLHMEHCQKLEFAESYDKNTTFTRKLHRNPIIMSFL